MRSINRFVHRSLSECSLKKLKPDPLVLALMLTLSWNLLGCGSNHGATEREPAFSDKRWDVTLQRGRVLEQVVFRTISDDTLFLGQDEKYFGVSLDSITEIREYRRSKLLWIVPMGAIAGGAAGALLGMSIIRPEENFFEDTRTVGRIGMFLGAAIAATSELFSSGQRVSLNSLSREVKRSVIRSVGNSQELGPGPMAEGLSKRETANDTSPRSKDTVPDSFCDITFSGGSVLPGVVLAELSGDTVIVEIDGSRKPISVSSIAQVRLVKRSKFLRRAQSGILVGASIGTLVGLILYKPYETSVDAGAWNTSPQMERVKKTIWLSLEGAAIGACLFAASDLLLSRDEVYEFSVLSRERKDSILRGIMKMQSTQ